MAATAEPALDLQALYAEAVSHYRAGALEKALPLFGRIIEVNPRIAEAQWQAALIFCDTDEFPRAAQHIEAAARLKPAEAVIWGTWADIAALSGDKDQERAFLTALKSAQIAQPLKLRLQDRFGSKRASSRQELPGVAPVVFDGILKLINSGDLAKAEAQAQAILRAHPKSPLANNLLGAAFAAQGRDAQALTHFQAASKLDMLYAEAFMNIGRTLLRIGKPDEGAKSLRLAIARAPDLEIALKDYGRILNQLSQPRRARPFLERLTRLNPKSVQGLIALGNTYTLLRNYEQARDYLVQAVKLTRETSPEALSLLSQALSHLGEDDAALEMVEKALAINPEFVLAVGMKAGLLQHFGRFDEAEPFFRLAMERTPLDGDLFRSFMTSHKAKPGDPIVDQMIERIREPALDDRARMCFAFAISKGLEDQKRHDEAFAFIRQANDLVRKLHPYDIADRYAEIAELKKSLAGYDWAGTAIPGTTDAAPIFVTGMPRSGTTLIEQIIASHSTVTGAGELAILPKMARRLILGANDDSAEGRRLESVPLERIAELGTGFAAQITARFPEAARITDKSITTYLHIGLVKLAIPNARIIVVRRDPRDNLLSIYKNRFPEGTHPYAYDLRDLAHYYATFVEMIDFWRSETPDWFTEVQYETLVANPEEESRKLIAACGLDWEDACLNFHENKRKIDTLSVYQVRQPISGGSVNAWERYEAELAPMIEILRERGLLPD